MTKQELRDALQSSEPVYVMVKSGIVGKLISYHIHDNPKRMLILPSETLEVKQLAPYYKRHTYHPLEDVKLLTVESVMKFKLMGIITE